MTGNGQAEVHAYFSGTTEQVLIRAWLFSQDKPVLRRRPLTGACSSTQRRLQASLLHEYETVSLQWDRALAR